MKYAIKAARAAFGRTVLGLFGTPKDVTSEFSQLFIHPRYLRVATTPPIPTKLPDEIKSKTPSTSGFTTSSAILDLLHKTQLPLSELFTYIDGHPSLANSHIVATSVYVRKMHPARHRRVLLKIRLESGQNVWLRLERLPYSRLALISGLGKTQANDKWAISNKQEDLVNSNDYELENEQVFVGSSEPVLHDLRHVVQAMSEVLTKYEITSSNCWAFSSILQEALSLRHGSVFQRGRLLHQNLSKAARHKVHERLFQLYAILDGNSIASILASMCDDSRFSAKFDVIHTALSLYDSWASLEGGTPQETLPVAQDLVDKVIDIAEWLWQQANYHEAVSVLGQTIEVFRKIAASTGSKIDHNLHLSILLRDYGRALEFTARGELAERIHEEALEIMGLLYAENPQLHSKSYADYVLSRDGWLHTLDREHDSVHVGAGVLRVMRAFYAADPEVHGSNLLLSIIQRVEAVWLLSTLDSLHHDSEELAAFSHKLSQVDLTTCGRSLAASLVRAHILCEEARHLRRWSGCGSKERSMGLEPLSLQSFHLANCLFSKASILHSTGRHVEACASIERALEIWRALLHSLPSPHFCSHFAISSHLRARILLASSLPDVAIAAMAESLEMVTPLYHRDPERYRPCYAVILLEYADWLFDFGLTVECRTIIDEALPLGRRLQYGDYFRYQPYLSEVFHLQKLLIDQS